MTIAPNPDLKTRLIAGAKAWAEANDAPLSRLGKRVAGDAAFFDRLERGGGLQLGTLERFAIELVEPESWPEGLVPEEVVAFGHAVGVSAPCPAPSAGEAGEISPSRRDAA